MTMAAIDADEVAILGMEFYFPRPYVEQSELGKDEHDGREGYRY